MSKLYAFWKYDVPPYLLGGEVIEILENGCVTIKGYTGYFNPDKIISLEKGLKLQKKLNKAEAKYKNAVKVAEEELDNTMKKNIPSKELIEKAKMIIEHKKKFYRLR